MEGSARTVNVLLRRGEPGRESGSLCIRHLQLLGLQSRLAVTLGVPAPVLFGKRRNEPAPGGFYGHLAHLLQDGERIPVQTGSVAMVCAACGGPESERLSSALSSPANPSSMEHLTSLLCDKNRSMAGATWIASSTVGSLPSL